MRRSNGKGVEELEAVERATLLGRRRVDDARAQGAGGLLFADIATAQELLGKEGRLSRIDVILDDAEAAMQRSKPDLGDINNLFDEANIGTALRRQAERVSDLSRY